MTNLSHCIVSLFAIAISLPLFADKKPDPSSLADYAREHEIIVHTLVEGVLPMLPKSDQTNNLNASEKVITLSGKGLKNIAGISTLLVIDGGKKIPLSEVKRLHLFLNDNELASLPNELFEMQNVIFLYLENNHLNEIPANIAKMKGLWGMYWTNNNISSLPPEVFSMKQLKKLQVSKNHLKELPEALGNLTGIVHFNMSSNELTAVPESIAKLTKLRVCDLSDNKITKLPEAFGAVKIFHQLRVKNNPLTTLPAGFAGMPGTIDITGTQIDVAKLPDGVRARISTEKHAGKEKPVGAKKEKKYPAQKDANKP